MLTPVQRGEKRAGEWYQGGGGRESGRVGVRKHGESAVGGGRGATKREQRDQSVKGNNNGVASANAAVNVNVDVEKKFIDVRAAALK